MRSEIASSEALVYTVPKAAKALRKGRNWVYEEVAAGRLPAVRLGSSIRIPKAAIARLLEGETGGDA